MKYDFVIDYNSDNVWSKAANQIEKGSTVLEFGPAAGYFTKYLKEERNCKVYIVEIDNDSFEHASQYSEDGICEDIENYGWRSRFKDIQFDYITFLDVLEHLRYPDRVLKACEELLAIDGSIIFSIPNIAHNSILINLFNNRFEYTEMGLLDNTHIHFFTYYQIMEMIKKAGLYASNMQAIYKHVGENEIKNSYKELPSDCIRSFKQRNFGDVYQFVFVCKKTNDSLGNKEILNNITVPAKNFEALLYVKEYIYRTPLYGNESKLVFEVDNKNNDEIQVDLCNAATAFIKINNIEINGIIYNKFDTNAVFSSGSFYYFNKKPYIHVITERIDLKEVIVNLEYIMLENDFYQFQNLISLIRQKDGEIQQKEKQLEEMALNHEAEFNSIAKQHEFKLKQIYNSKAYKVAIKLQAIKQKIFKRK